MNEVPALPNEFRFADVRVDTRAHQVLRAGSPLPLEPKAYAVLVELLRRPGAAIARDDLLDQVWGHRHVTPGVLNRIIAMLRRELGDDADHPHLIRTVHGTGYSFIGTLLSSEAAAEPTRPAPPPRRSLVLPLAAIAAMLLAALSFWPRDEPRAPAAPVATPPAPLLVLLPLQPASEVPADVELAAGLGDSLDEALRRVAGLRVIARESTQTVASDTTDPWAIARALGATQALLGSVRTLEGDRIAIELRLVAARSPTSAWTARFEQPRAQAFRFLGPALDALQAELLGGSPRSTDPVLVASIGAQDLYWLARRHQLTGMQGLGAQRAIPLLEQALQQDPGFALGWTALAEAHRSLGIVGIEPMDASVARASEAVRRALEIDPDLPAAWLGKAMIETMQWHAAEAEAPARRAMELAPDDSDVLSVTGNIALYLGRPREALALHRRVSTTNPRSFLLPALIGGDLLALGEFDAAMAHARENAPDPARFPLSDALRRARVTYGKLALAAQPTDPPSRSLYVILAYAQALSMLGRHDEAEAQIARIDVRPPYPPLYVSVRLDMFWRRGAKADALAWLRGDGRDIAQQPWLDAGLAQAHAVAGDDVAALRTYDAALAEPTARARLAYSWYMTRNGISHVANWIALRRSAGKTYTAELAAMKAELARFRANGVGYPYLDYHDAVTALLADDATAAETALRRAIDRGWRDTIALDTDVAWRSVASQPWLLAERARIERLLAEEAALPVAASGG